MSDKFDEFVKHHLQQALQPLIDDAGKRQAIRLMIKTANQEKNLQGLLMTECGVSDLEDISGATLNRFSKIAYSILDMHVSGTENVVYMEKWKRK